MEVLEKRNPRSAKHGFLDHFAVDVGKSDLPIVSLKRFSEQEYGGLKQSHLDWLIAQGVTVECMIHPEPMRFAGTEPGGDWLAFEEDNDWILWQPKTGRLVSENGNTFALGQDAIWNAGTYAFGGCLHIFTNPLAWLVNKRDGIVVLNWSRVFEELRDCQRIAVAEPLLATFDKAMRPQHRPAIFVLTDRRAA